MFDINIYLLSFGVLLIWVSKMLFFLNSGRYRGIDVDIRNSS